MSSSSSWLDGRKSSSTTTVLLARQELQRKQRLGKVKSIYANKFKKLPSSGRKLPGTKKLLKKKSTDPVSFSFPSRTKPYDPQYLLKKKGPSSAYRASSPSLNREEEQEEEQVLPNQHSHEISEPFAIRQVSGNETSFHSESHVDAFSFLDLSKDHHQLSSRNSSSSTRPTSQRHTPTSSCRSGARSRSKSRLKSEKSIEPSTNALDLFFFEEDREVNDHERCSTASKRELCRSLENPEEYPLCPKEEEEQQLEKQEEEEESEEESDEEQYESDSSFERDEQEQGPLYMNSELVEIDDKSLMHVNASTMESVIVETPDSRPPEPSKAQPVSSRRSALRDKHAAIMKEREEQQNNRVYHRGGSSLSDLKEEHREALDLLRELGGHSRTIDDEISEERN